MAMPKLGMTMHEGRVVSWPRAIGSRVEKGEVVLVIESEKAEVEIESPASGVLVKTEPRAIELMPMLVPLALLGALEIDTLKRGFSGALDWFGILTFGLVSALVWSLWFDAYAHGMSPAVAKLFRDTEAGYRPPFGWTALATHFPIPP